MKRRPAFSLMETVAAVVVLAVAIPAVSVMLADAASASRDAAIVVRASALARAALEHVLADIHSPAPGLGFDALAGDPDYLDAPTTGLYARLAPTVAAYAPFGMSLRLERSGPVDVTGASTGDPAKDVCRDVTAVVLFPPTRRGSDELRVGMRVAKP